MFITHQHGDHVCGVLRFLDERDKVLSKLPESERSKIFVMVPPCLLDWVKMRVAMLQCPDKVVVKPHHLLNPQQYYLY